MLLLESMSVARSPKDRESEPPSRLQVNVGFEPEMRGRIEQTARVMGLKHTDLIRMIVSECLTIYESRASRIKRGQAPPEIRTDANTKDSR